MRAKTVMLAIGQRDRAAESSSFCFVFCSSIQSNTLLSIRVLTSVSPMAPLPRPFPGCAESRSRSRNLLSHYKNAHGSGGIPEGSGWQECKECGEWQRNKAGLKMRRMRPEDEAMRRIKNTRGPRARRHCPEQKRD
jgi:hypothetical protein